MIYVLIALLVAVYLFSGICWWMEGIANEGGSVKYLLRLCDISERPHLLFFVELLYVVILWPIYAIDKIKRRRR